MPIAVGIRGFFETTLQEWQRGVAILTGPPPAGEVTNRGPILRPGPGVATTVTIPGLFDVVKLGAPDPNAPETKAHNREIFQAIRNSPEPEYVAGFGSIMTAIDNVRDVLALGEIAGRLTLAVNGASEVLAAGGSITLRALGSEALAAVTGRLAFRIGVGELAAVGAATALGELILPVLAVVVTAVTIAEIAHWMATFAIVGYAALCKGPAEAAFAAVPALIWGRGLKGNISKLSRMNPWSVLHEVREVRAGNVRTFVGHRIIEGGRATAVIGGYGWLLGAVVGFMVAGAFALQRVANGDPVKIDTRPIQRFPAELGQLATTLHVATPADTGAAAAALIGRSPIPGSNIALRAAQDAAECLWSLPALVRNLDYLSPNDFACVLGANLLALDILEPYLFGRGWQGLAAQIADLGIPPPPAWMPQTQELIAEADPESGGDTKWPWPGMPGLLNIRELENTWLEEVDANLQRWFARYDGFIEAGLCGSLLDSIVQRLLYLITESPDGDRQTAAPNWKVLFSLAEGNRQILVTYEPVTIQAFFEAALARMARESRNSLTPLELDAVAASVGMRLLVIEPPPSPPPRVSTP